MLLKRVKHNTAKAVVWLTVAVFALPTPPASACDCSTRRQVSNCCCGRTALSESDAQQGCRSAVQPSSCCSAGQRSTCCMGGTSTTPPVHGCSCGTSCGCKLGQFPSQPADPLPAQQGSPSKLLGADTLASLSGPITVPAVRSLAVSSAQPIAIGSSLDRCIFLSRFTL